MLKPRAVITSIEDYPAALDRELLAAYLRTLYAVPELDLQLHIGPLPTDLVSRLMEMGCTRFTFITAVNPRSELLPEAENARRQAALFQELCAVLPARPVPAVHLNPAGHWPPEASWFAPGLEDEDAVRLGRVFEQNAVVVWQVGKPVELWWL